MTFIRHSQQSQAGKPLGRACRPVARTVAESAQNTPLPTLTEHQKETRRERNEQWSIRRIFDTYGFFGFGQRLGDFEEKCKKNFVGKLFVRLTEPHDNLKQKWMRYRRLKRKKNWLVCESIERVEWFSQIGHLTRNQTQLSSQKCSTNRESERECV